MLVFFLHGVATQDADYSKPLQNLLREEFNYRKQPLPHFYAGFWGNVLKQTGQMWNCIHQDLQNIKVNHPQVDVEEIFRYREMREGFISQFFGDALTYFNSERGWDIRDTIAEQIYKFLKHSPQETDLHFVSHSLGTVILWDILFSERFASDDPAYTIRALLSHSHNSAGKVYLRSLTTMGAPILFFNMMLGITPAQIETFTATYKANILRWINLIHASDLMAYPLQSSLNTAKISNLFFRDQFIQVDANGAEKAARMFGQVQAAMAMGISDAHSSYWQSRSTAKLIANNLLGNIAEIDSASIVLNQSNLLEAGLLDLSGKLQQKLGII